MYGILMENVVTFKLYGGNGFLLVLFLASLAYLLITEKDMRKKLVIAIAPFIVLLLFFLPITKIAFVAILDDGSDTYYRIMWMLPMGICIAYAGCRIFEAHKRIGIVVVSALIILCGSIVYKNQYVSKAENLYHIPQVAIDICDVISPDEGEPRVRAVFPEELVHFVRQYDTNIMMPYGRDIIAWNYYNAVHEAFEKVETINAEELLAATRETKCRYIIMHKDRSIDVPLEELGLTIVDTIGGYNIYEDPEMVE